jgi:hypothetical protein
MRKWMVNLGLLGVSCMLALVIGEIVLRMVAPELTEFQRAMTFSDLTVRKLKPNLKNVLIHPVNGEPPFFLTTNSLGLRSNAEIGIEVPPNTRRILCLGDSYTFGFGVEGSETYPHHLETCMNQWSDRQHRYEVINAGFASGLSTDSQYLYLREIGVKLSPDVVIVRFCVINDLIDISKNRWVLDNEGRLQEIYNRTDRIIPLALRRTAIATALLTYIKPKEVMDKKEQPLDRTALDRVKFALSGMQTMGKARGFRLLLFIIPIPPPELVSGKERGSVWDRTREELITFCTQKEIPFFDPLDGLTVDHYLSARSGKMHFNKKGNQWVSLKICDFLKEL